MLLSVPWNVCELWVEADTVQPRMYSNRSNRTEFLEYQFMDVNVLWRTFAPAVLALGMTVATAPASATVVTYDFEGLADSTTIISQFSGLTFSNTIALKAGFSLNEFEFPPRSGDVVVSDDGGAINISFAAPVFSVGGYFTYGSALTLQAFDSSNNLLGVAVASLFGSNLGLSGDPGSSSNELLSYADIGGAIARVTITGDLLGGSFVMDDLRVDNGNSVPEPQTMLLALALLGAGCLPRGWMRGRHAV